MTRGVPGTHDYKIIQDFFKKVKNQKFKHLTVPRFDKSIDDRCKKKQWYKIHSKPDVVILEGWCVGAKSQKNKELSKTINSLERTKDKKCIWRKYVNNQLKTNYKKMFEKLDELIYLKATSFKLLQKWRIVQEKRLSLKTKNKKNLKIMNKEDIVSFMQTYQRITQSMFKETPKYASVIMKLNDKHQINSINFKK